MKRLTLLMLGSLAITQCKSSSDSGSPGTPDPNPSPNNCTTVLQAIQLNDSLKLKDLDSTALFIKNNAQQLQQLEPEQAAAVWDCMEKR